MECLNTNNNIKIKQYSFVIYLGRVFHEAISGVLIVLKVVLDFNKVDFYIRNINYVMMSAT